MLYVNAQNPCRDLYLVKKNSNENDEIIKILNRVVPKNNKG
jgi:hypothetical protein